MIMLVDNIIAFISLAALASATATPKPKVKFIDANYDDITVIPALPLANPLATYQGLTYTGFATRQTGIGGELQLSGVAPHSNPNSIVSGIQQTVLIDRNPNFSINQTESKYFDLKYFWFGCVANTVQGVTGLAQQCTINVRCYTKLNDANAVGSLQFSFNPSVTTVKANMVQATFDSKFLNIQRVDIVQVESTSGAALNVVVLDNVGYNLYK